MARISGHTGTLSIGGVPKLGLTSINADLYRALNDATGMDSGGYEEDTDGVAGGRITADANWDTGVGGDAPTVKAGDVVAWEFETDSVPAKTYSGNARIERVTVATVVRGNVTWNVTLKVQGEWTEA